MRENIGLYRGKRCDNNEWVEGYLVKFGKESFSDNDRYGIMEDTTLIAKVVTDNRGSSLIMKECDYVYHNVKVTEVIPETVGEYTGFTDKNNKMIFEGDIVKVEGKPYEVKYMFGQFFVGINMPIAYKRFDCEVISNIHDKKLEDFENGC